MTQTARARNAIFAIVGIMILFPLSLAAAGYYTPRVEQSAQAPASSSPLPTSTAFPNGPTFYISYREGAPGSQMTFTGLEFPQTQQVSIWVNGRFVGAVPNSEGWFVFVLNTKLSNQGRYDVVVDAGGLTRQETFQLDVAEPTRNVIFDWPLTIFPLPAIGITATLYIPAVQK